MQELRESWTLLDVMEANDWINIQEDQEWFAEQEAKAKSKRK